MYTHIHTHTHTQHCRRTPPHRTHNAPRTTRRHPQRPCHVATAPHAYILFRAARRLLTQALHLCLRNRDALRVCGEIHCGEAQHCASKGQVGAAGSVSQSTFLVNMRSDFRATPKNSRTSKAVDRAIPTPGRGENSQRKVSVSSVWCLCLWEQGPWAQALSRAHASIFAFFCKVVYLSLLVTMWDPVERRKHNKSHATRTLSLQLPVLSTGSSSGGCGTSSPRQIETEAVKK